MDAKPVHWLIDKLLPQVVSVVILASIMWTRLAVLESKIEEKWAYAMDERLSIKQELTSLKTQVSQLTMDITTIKATMQYWQETATRRRSQPDETRGP